MRPQDDSQRRPSTSQQKRPHERDPRVSQSDSPGEDASTTRRERRPEIPPAAPPTRDDDEARDAGVVEEVVKSDQVDG